MVAIANELWRGKTIRGVQAALFAVIVLLIAAAAYITVLVMERQSTLGMTSRYNLAFSAGQGVTEYMRLRQSLMLLSVAPESKKASRDVRLRYEILVNRLALFGSGEFAVFVNSTEHRKEAFGRIVKVVGYIDDLVRQSDAAEIDVQKVLKLTAPIEEDFIGLASDSNSYGATAVASDQYQLFNLYWIFSGLALTLAVSGVFLYLLNRLQNKQLVAARRELGDVNEELAGQNFLFVTALDNMSHGLCMFDENQRLIVSNQRMSSIFHLEPIPRGTTIAELSHLMVEAGACEQDDVRELKEKQEVLTAGKKADTIMLCLKDGRTVLVSHQPMDNGGWTATYEDITERHKAQAQVSHMARHDALTGLPNRVLLRERLAATLKDDRAEGLNTAVMFVDLDNFKNINDTHGHPFGDVLLREVADRVKSVFRETDTVSRVGGDEFVIVHGGLADTGCLEGMAQRLIERLSEPFKIAGRQVISGASVGIALNLRDEHGADDLLKNADLALYEAKAAGRGVFAFYRSDMSLQMQRRSKIETQLMAADFDDQFQLVFQPITDVATGRAKSVEALIRWKKPQVDPVTPQELIKIAEETGIIVDLGNWILRTACSAAMKMPVDVNVAVNLSPMQFRRGGIVEVVEKGLADTGLDPSRLHLEITETLLLEDSNEVIRDLLNLKELGVSISLDDFGTGYSSLSYLQKFPVDKIKIDRMFVQEISENSNHRAIVQTIINMADALGMKTVAEGVETAEQQQVLRSAGCDEIQGYLYSKPLLLNDLLNYLNRKPQVAVARAV